MRHSTNKEIINIDFDFISSELNNKKVIALLDEQSPSYKILGPEFIGRLVGRTKKKCYSISKKVDSLTILSHEFLTHKIPVEDIRVLAEIN
jgi:hypothetical protein